MRSLVRLNVELAKLETKQKATALGIAAALAIVALVIVLYAVGLIFFELAVVLDLWLPLWASLLIVIVVMLLAAVVLVLLAKRSAEKAFPAQPTQAIEEGELTVQTVKSHV